MVPGTAFAHDRIVHGIVVPNGYAPAWEDGRVNRDIGNNSVAAFVDAGRFHSLAAAQSVAEGLSGEVVQIRGTGVYQVRLGPYRNRDAAQAGLDAAHSAGLGHGRVR